MKLSRNMRDFLAPVLVAFHVLRLCVCLPFYLAWMACQWAWLRMKGVI